jgi:hypothetical protein
MSWGFKFMSSFYIRDSRIANGSWGIDSITIVSFQTSMALEKISARITRPLPCEVISKTLQRRTGEENGKALSKADR